MPSKGPPNKSCFVVGPIGRPGTPERNHADWLNAGIIKPLFSAHFPSFLTVRADEISVPGMIDAQIINHLFDADLVISDMSFRNANAFYEMGIRHAVQKPIIHMFKAGEEIPFDVQPYRAIEFAVTHPSDLERAKENLRIAIDRTLDASYKVDNPVIRARGFAELEKNATAPEKLLLDRIATLETRINRIDSTPSKLPRQKKVKDYNRYFWIHGREPITIEQHHEFMRTLGNSTIPIRSARSDGKEIEIELEDDSRKNEAIDLVNDTMLTKFPWIQGADDIPF